MSQCQGLTKQGHRCLRKAEPGKDYCSIHIPVYKRRKLDRQSVIDLINENGSADGLNLANSDLTDARLGSGDNILMPSMEGAIFGVYGDVRSGAMANNLFITRARLKRSKWIYATLNEANFYRADLSEADLRYTDLHKATFVEANLEGANLYGANLSDAILRRTNLRGADLYGAIFSGRTDLRRENIGGKILQEDQEAYADFVKKSILPSSSHSLEIHLQNRLQKGIRVYEQLKNHFEENGNMRDATWAYLRGRKLKRQWIGQQAAAQWRAKDFRTAILTRASWLGEWVVELLCDYGESVWRVIFWLFALIFVISPILIACTGGLIWNGDNLKTYMVLQNGLYKQLYVYFQYILYAIDTTTTASFSELKPAADLVRLTSGLLALVGIFLAGLLGFVAGNRIRNS